MLDRFLPSKIRAQKRLSSYSQFDTEKETGGLRKAAGKVPKEKKKMPSWEQTSDGYPCYVPYYTPPASNSAVNVSTASKSQGYLHVSSTQSRRKSALVSTFYLPLPYVKPKSMAPSTNRKTITRMDSGISLPSPTESTQRQEEGRKLKPLPLSSLPSLPQAIRPHPRSELQRRNSPTSSGGFESYSPLSSQSAVGAAPAVQSISTWPMENKVDGPTVVVVEEKQEKEEKEEETYTLTLLTTCPLTDNASRLCLNNNPSNSPLPPANITLFPTLPAKQLEQIKNHLFLLSDKIKAFKLSTGTPTKKQNGQILLSVSQGEREIHRLFVSLRTKWWTLLPSEDRAYQGIGWPLLNEKDDIDIERIDEMARAIREVGVVCGWATGFCLWKKRKGGEWVVEKEFLFERDGGMVDGSLLVRVRSLMSPSSEMLALRRKSSSC